MTLFKKKKKEVNKTDISIYDIFHIKSQEAASVTIDGTDPQILRVTVSTVPNLYTITIKQEEKEEKTMRKNLIEFWDKNKWTANKKNTKGGVEVISEAAYGRLVNKLTYKLNKKCPT